MHWLKHITAHTDSFYLFVEYCVMEYVWTSRNIFFAKYVAPRWASNHGPFYGNYRCYYYITPGDGSFHAISG